MRALLLVIALGALSLPKIGWAESIYIKCHEIKGEHGFEPFSVKIDEASEKITHTDSDGSAFKTTAFFSEDEISYKHITDEQSSGTYVINRSNLKVHIAYTFPGLLIKRVGSSTLMYGKTEGGNAQIHLIEHMFTTTSCSETYHGHHHTVKDSRFLRPMH